MSSRLSIKPILTTIPDERQKLARHYGVHPYFTRRSANVIQAYLKCFSEEADVVLDPFGGSGVTAIEAFLLGRVGIQNDLNPFANFLATGIADTALPSTQPLRAAFQRVEAVCREAVHRLETDSETQVAQILNQRKLPANIHLPRTSDAEFFFDLFTKRQLAALSLLKDTIDAEPDIHIRNLLLLAWSAALAKLNKTFISAKGRAASRGGSSIFSIYRYKLAKDIVELPIWETFAGRFANVLAAKQEIFAICDHRRQLGNAPLDSARNFRVYQQDAVALCRDLGANSVDYIFTDPPYGGYITYLDLSILWNHWLGFAVTENMRREEIIVGGEQKLTEEHYKRKLAESIRACVAVLKPDRWMSVVFQHWDISYFGTILQAAAAEQAQLKAAVTQEREVIWSMHKKKNSETVLAGEMILTFYKSASQARGTTARESAPRLFAEILDDILRQAQNRDELTSQYIFNKLILAAWERNSLSELSVTREKFAEELRARGWAYDTRRHVWRRAGRGTGLLWAEQAEGG